MPAKPLAFAPAVEAVEAEPVPSSALAVRKEQTVTAAPAEYEKQLDPRSMQEARSLAQDLHASRLFSAYGTAQAVLSTVMLGRELGLPAIASLRGVHIVEGRHTLGAGLMTALILRSGLAEYFRPVTLDDGTLDADELHATFETKRKGPGGRLTRLTHTIEMAQRAGLVKEKSGWVKNPGDMLFARAESRLARLVYPDVLFGLFTPEEISELSQVAA